MIAAAAPCKAFVAPAKARSARGSGVRVQAAWT